MGTRVEKAVARVAWWGQRSRRRGVLGEGLVGPWWWVHLREGVVGPFLARPTPAALAAKGWDLRELGVCRVRRVFVYGSCFAQLHQLLGSQGLFPRRLLSSCRAQLLQLLSAQLRQLLGGHGLFPRRP